VRALSLMPVKVVPDPADPIFIERLRAWSGIVWIERTLHDPSNGPSRRLLEPLLDDACSGPKPIMRMPPAPHSPP
jgi:hypothetical protein